MLALSRATRLLAGLVLVVLAVPLAVSTPWAKAFLFDRATAWARSRFGVDIHASRFDYNLAGLRVLVEDLSVADLATPDQPLARVGRLELDLAASALRGRLDFDGIRARDARVVIDLATGSPRPPSSPGDRPQEIRMPPFSIDTLQIENLDLRIGDEDVRFDARGVSADLRGNRLPNVLAGSLAATRGLEVSFDTDAIRVVFDRADAQASLEDNSRVAAEVRASSAVADVHATGNVPLSPDGPLAVTYNGSVVLAEFPRWWRASPAWTGTVALAGAVTGPLRAPDLSFHATSRDLAWSAFSPATLDAGGHVSPAGLSLESLSLASGGASLHGNGTLAIRRTEPSRFSGRWTDLGADVVAALLGHRLEAVSPAAIAGSATLAWTGPQPQLDAIEGHVAATLSGGATAPAATGTVTANGADAQWHFTYQQALDGATKAVAEGDLTLHPEDLPGSPVRGTVSVQSTSAHAAIGQLRRAGVPLPTIVEELHPGVLGMDGQVDGTVGRPRLRAQFGVDMLRIGSVEPFWAKGSIAIDGDGLTLTPASIDSAWGGAVFTGTLPWSAGDGAGTFTLEIIEPAPLLPMLPPVWQPTGRLNATGTWRGTMRRPSITAHLIGSDVTANGFGLTALAADLAFADGTLTASAVEGTQSTGGAVSASGSWRLEDSAIAATLQARDIEAIVGGRGPIRLSADVDARDRVARITASAPAYNATVDGQVTLEASLPFEGRLTLSGSDIAGLAGLAGVDGAALADVHVSADATIEVSGTGRDLAATTATLRVTHLDGTIREQPVLVTQEGRLQLRDERVSVVEPLQLAWGTSSLTLAEASSAAARQGIAISMEGSLSELTTVVPGVLPERVAADGTVKAEILLGDRLMELQPSGALTLSIASLTRDDIELARDATLVAEADLTTVRVRELRGTVLGGPLEARGTAPAEWIRTRGGTGGSDPSEPATFWLKAKPAVSTLVTLLGTDTREITGAVDLTIEGSADAPRLDAVRATVRNERGEVAIGAFTLSADEPTALHLEAGLLHVDTLQWHGPQSTIAASGSIALVDGRDARLRLDGNGSLAPLTLFLPARIDGQATFGLELSGPPGHREWLGTIAVEDGSMVAQPWRLAMANWSGSVLLGRDRIEIRQLRGQFNGGEATIDGRFPIGGGTTEPQSVAVTVRGAFLDLPRGLRSQLDATLEWSHGDGEARLSGEAIVTARTYREPITEIARIAAALIEQSGASPPELPSAFAGTKLDVHLSTVGPLAMTNSVAQVELLPDLQLTGSVSRPALRGQVAVVDDGRIQFSGRQYRLRDSRLEFSPERGLMPRLAVSGETRVAEYTVFLRFSGPAGEIQTSLSSDPPLGQRDLQTLLVTGQTESLGRGNASDQNAVGAVSGDVLGVAGQFAGFDAVTVSTTDDLALVSSDVDPALRLTVSKRIGRRFELVLSDNLDDNELTWVIIYRPRPGFEFRALSRDNTEYTGEFRQEIPFGPGVSPPRTITRKRVAKDRVVEVTVSGEPGLSAPDVLSATSLRAGDEFDFARWLDDRDRIAALYRERGYFAARIVPTRRVRSDVGTERVALDYRVTRGPRTVLSVSGYAPPKDLEDRLRQAWSDSVLVDLLEGDLSRVMREHLIDTGFLRATVEVDVDHSQPDLVTASMRVEPGVRSSERRITFSGNTAIGSEALLDAVSKSDTYISAWKDPAPLVELLQALYAARGYLAASATPGALEFSTDTATLPIAITEGPQARVASLTVTGADRVPVSEAAAATGLIVGAPYVAGAEQPARIALERHYRDLGYRDVAVDLRSTVNAGEGRVDVAIGITEGPNYVVRAVQTTGVQSTRDATVERATRIEPGSPASPTLADETRRRLYDIGTFRSAEVTFVPVEGAATASTVPVDAIVTLQESKRFLLLYGVEATNQYQSLFDQRVTTGGIAADLRDRNFLGRGWTLGAGVRYEPSFESARLLATVPKLGSRRIRTNLYADTRSEERARTEEVIFRDDETTLTLEQRWRPRPPVELSWGYHYNFRDLRFIGAVANEDLFDFKGNLASLAGAVVVDRRDNMFDAKRGWLMSTTAEWGLQPIGSDFDYLRTVVRASQYQPVGPLTLASNVRWGTLVPIKGTPPISVLDIFFTAGGTQTVRGYQQDSLSAYYLDLQGQHIPVGGTRLLVLNEEVRFPLFWLFSGAGFVDAGNTFTDEKGIVLADMAVGAGFGLRIRTPLAPVRLDLGFPVHSQTGQTSIRWHFSIGQIF